MQSTIPRTGGLPLVGALPGLLRSPLATLERARVAGDISRLSLGFVDAVTLHNPEYIDRVFRTNHRVYTKDGPFWSSLRPLLRNGLPMSTGTVWRRHRRMMQPHFNRRSLMGVADLIIDAVDETMKWDDIDNEWNRVEFGARVPHLTMNTLSAAIFGTSTPKERANILAPNLEYAQRQIFGLMLASNTPSWFPIPGQVRFHRALHALHSEIRDMIEWRKRMSEGNDLLWLLISSTTDEDGEGLTDEQLHEEVLDLMVAGYETTATSIQWAVALLAAHPEIWGRLREECDAVLGGQLPRTEDIRRLHYARWVMQESMRLYPPVWWLPRLAIEDDEIGGYPISKGSIVAPVMYTTHRHPDFWSDPSGFEPERFEPTRTATRHPLTWFPFGAGPRKCIGQELSLIESTLILAILTQRYELASADHMPTPKLRTALVADRGVYVRMRRRRGTRPSSSAIPRYCAAESSSAINV